jgi:hypothetical protein
MLLFALVCPSLQFTHYSEKPGSCDIIGDPDTYGIGVRISFYLNWAAAFLALLFNLHDEHKGSRRAINAIAIVVVTNTLINTTKGSFAMLEWYIVFSMVLILPLTASIPFSWTAIKDDIIGISCLLLLYSIYGVIQPWLYFTIPRQGYKDGCPAKIFLYAPFSVYNTHWVGFTKATAILGSISSAILILVFLSSIYHGILDGLRAEPPQTKDPGKTTSGHLEQIINKTVLKWSARYLKVVIGFSGASSIAFVEETIRVNHIDLSGAPLTATGQLIPFVVGLFSVVAVMWNCIKRWRKGKGKPDQVSSQSRPLRHMGANGAYIGLSY